MSKKILLVEPVSHNTYPPLGLLKISLYHKLQGDYVHYTYGNNVWASEQFWDVIYITSMFTWDFDILIKTIRYYSKNHYNFRNIKIGGVAATLLGEEVEALTGIMPHKGTIKNPDEFLDELSNTREFNYLKHCQPYVDYLPPDYEVALANESYQKLLSDSYMLYCTKGCPNSCNFCAVNTLEPQYVDYVPISPRVEYIKRRFGKKFITIFR